MIMSYYLFRRHLLRYHLPLVQRQFHPPTYPQQFKAEMRPLWHSINFPRRDVVSVDVQLCMPLLVQRSPICQTPEPPVKIVQPLTLHKPGLIICRFSAKRRPCSHLISSIKESYHE